MNPILIAFINFQNNGKRNDIFRLISEIEHADKKYTKNLEHENIIVKTDIFSLIFICKEKKLVPYARLPFDRYACIFVS